MRDIHRSTTTWFARRGARRSAARPLHHSFPRKQLTLEPLEGRALLSLTTWMVNDLGDTGTAPENSGDLHT